VAQLERGVEAVRKVTSFKRGYKGTSIAIFKEVATVVDTVGKELARRTQSGESQILKEENSRLRREEVNLRRELKSLRGEVAELREKINSLSPKHPPLEGHWRRRLLWWCPPPGPPAL